MELIFWVWLLTLLQGLCFVPRGAVAFVGLPGGPRALRGPGLRLFNPWPKAVGWRAGALPFRLEGGELVCDASLRRSARDPFPAVRRVAIDAIAEVGFRGAVVRIDDRPFARTVSKEQARELVTLIEALRRADAAKRPVLLRDHVERSFDLAAFRAEAERIEQRTRWLGRIGNAQAVVAFAFAPALVWRFDESLGLLLVAPAAAALHLCGLVLLVLAHRRLWPQAGGDRFELAFTAALYPPLLLHGRELLTRDCAARFHPATVATHLLREPRRTGFLRRALAHARLRPTPEAPRQAELLLGLARAAGIEREALEGPPAGPEPDAVSYCPLCDAGHRAGFTQCGSCGVPTRPVRATA